MHLSMSFILLKDPFYFTKVNKLPTRSSTLVLCALINKSTVTEEEEKLYLKDYSSLKGVEIIGSIVENK
jgi:hypothetical protein